MLLDATVHPYKARIVLLLLYYQQYLSLLTLDI
jgi:hypothetical protein